MTNTIDTLPTAKHGNLRRAGLVVAAGALCLALVACNEGTNQSDGGLQPTAERVPQAPADASDPRAQAPPPEPTTTVE